MSLTKTLLAAATALTVALPAYAGDIVISDAYARSSGPMSASGAAFLSIQNTGATDDRLLDVASDVAKRVELHTHRETAEGVMQMIHVTEGFPVAAGQTHLLQRGGDHIMFMGLSAPMIQGDMLTVTLAFEKAGDITVEIPVDQTRKPALN